MRDYLQTYVDRASKEMVRWLTIIVLFSVALAESLAAASPRDCDLAAAAAYDREADQYEVAADERYRAWASARVAADPCGSARDLEQAARLYAAAKRSRERAAEFRSGECGSESAVAE